MRALALLAAAALAGCPSTPPTTCPGDVVATLEFQASLQPDSGCTFASGMAPGIGFSGLVAWTPDGGAAVCQRQIEAGPHLGTHDGDHLLVRSTWFGVPIADCSCAADVAEVIEGDLQRVDGGSVVGFLGELRNDVAPQDGGSATPGPGLCGCGLPCTVRYALTGHR